MPTEYEGRQDHIRALTLPAIDTFHNVYADREYAVRFEVPEFTCVCPKTGLPDFATLVVEYSPNDRCVELKSFKEYILAFRDLGIFHENVVNRLCDDLAAALDPRWIKIEGVFNPRGGIATTVKREWRRA